MSLERDPNITPAIEEMHKLTIEKREIESNMALPNQVWNRTKEE